MKKEIIKATESVDKKYRCEWGEEEVGTAKKRKYLGITVRSNNSKREG